MTFRFRRLLWDLGSELEELENKSFTGEDLGVSDVGCGVKCLGLKA